LDRGREAADEDEDGGTGVDFTDFLGEDLGAGAGTVAETGVET
jgi:hypothetical protein